LRKEEENAKKAVKARGAFNSEFYNGVSRVEIAVKRMRVASYLFLRIYRRARTAGKVGRSQKAFEQIRAKEYRMEMFKKRAEVLLTQASTGRLKGTIYETFHHKSHRDGNQEWRGLERPTNPIAFLTRSLTGVT